MQPGCGLPPVVIYKDDHQPCDGEKRAGLWPPPALSFKDVHQPCWGGGRAELGSCRLHGLAARFFLQRPEEKEANLGYVVLAGPQVPPAVELPAPWLGWSCPHSRRRAGERASSSWRVR
jgi:hypothetical protein